MEKEMIEKIDETKKEMENKLQKIIEEKDKEYKIEKEKINKNIENEIQKRINEEVNKKLDKEIQKKLDEEIKKYDNLRCKHKFIIKNKDGEELNIKKVSMDIPEEIKTEGFDAEIEKLRKKNILTTEKNDINKIDDNRCSENCVIF